VVHGAPVLCHPSIALKTTGIRSVLVVTGGATFGCMSSLPLQFFMLTLAGWMTLNRWWRQGRVLLRCSIFSAKILAANSGASYAASS
jgi:hypothetical protein